MNTNVTKGGWVEYSSNNSGGDWWLDDDDWKALEAAGWKVEWNVDRARLSELDSNPEGRFLGALATSAKRYGVSMRHAIEEWENVTGESSNDLGCSCCGVPHSFSLYSSSGAYLDSYSPSYPTQGDTYW